MPPLLSLLWPTTSPIVPPTLLLARLTSAVAPPQIPSWIPSPSTPHPISRTTPIPALPPYQLSPRSLQSSSKSHDNTSILVTQGCSSLPSATLSPSAQSTRPPGQESAAARQGSPFFLFFFFFFFFPLIPPYLWPLTRRLVLQRYPAGVCCIQLQGLPRRVSALVLSGLSHPNRQCGGESSQSRAVRQERVQPCRCY